MRLGGECNLIGAPPSRSLRRSYLRLANMGKQHVWSLDGIKTPHRRPFLQTHRSKATNLELPGASRYRGGVTGSEQHVGEP